MTRIIKITFTFICFFCCRSLSQVAVLDGRFLYLEVSGQELNGTHFEHDFLVFDKLISNKCNKLSSLIRNNSLSKIHFLNRTNLVLISYDDALLFANNIMASDRKNVDSTMKAINAVSIIDRYNLSYLCFKNGCTSYLMSNPILSAHVVPVDHYLLEHQNNYISNVIQRIKYVMPDIVDVNIFLPVKIGNSVR